MELLMMMNFTVWWTDMGSSRKIC